MKLLPQKPQNILIKMTAGLMPLLLALGITVVVVSILLLVLGVSPLAAFSTLLRGALGSPLRVGETLVMTIPLFLAGLSCAVAFRCQLWNIGVEGQLYMGAIVAALVGIGVTGFPAFIILPAAILLGILGGGFWGAIPGFLKVRFKANEVMVTIMLNYVALLVANLVISGPLSHTTMPRTIDVQEAAWLPMIWQRARLHSGLILAIVCGVLVYFVLFHTVLGYRIRATGLGLSAARNAGIKIEKTMVLAFAMSGAIAGLGGAIQILGVHHSLIDHFSPGYGFTGIIVALVGRNHPGWILFSAFFFAALFVGSQAMQIVTHIPVSMVHVIQACLILIALGAKAIRVS
jgi:simple sugar transport system permease protein